MIDHAFPLPDDAEYSPLGSLDLVPANVSFLASAPGQVCPRATIGFKWHARSQHLSIENFQPPSYYENYLMTATYSSKMQALQRSQLEKLCSLHEGPAGPRSFIEIGCGDGSFMKHAQQKIPCVKGIEPSHKFAAEALRNGLDVLIGYVGSERSLTAEKFDSFASRQVFEHLPDPLDVLIGIRQMLNPGAVGLIEVPNGHRALRQKRFYEFFPDHVNYFSVNSLVALASDAGFNCIGCFEAFEGDYLELWVRYEPAIESLCREMDTTRKEVCTALSGKVMEISSRGERVAIWGCGAKTLSILAVCSDEMLTRIAGIIDSDPHKDGLYVPNTTIQVVSPEQGRMLCPDVVFILALSYRSEIAAAIRDNIPSCKKIFTLDDQGQIVTL